MQHTIKAPNKNFNGVRSGLTFVNGQAHTEDKKLAEQFARDGYEVSGVRVKAEEVKQLQTIPTLTEVRVPLTDPDGEVRERSVAVLGSLHGGSQNGPDWTSVAETEPTDPVAVAEARGEYSSDAEVIADKVKQETEKLEAAMPEPPAVGDGEGDEAKKAATTRTKKAVK